MCTLGARHQLRSRVSAPATRTAVTTDNPELAEQPAAAGDALRPGEPVGAVLEIEDERSGEQDAD